MVENGTERRYRAAKGLGTKDGHREDDLLDSPGLGFFLIIGYGLPICVFGDFDLFLPPPLIASNLLAAIF